MKINDFSNYNELLKNMLETIHAARYRAYQSLNKHHISLNFSIGKLIVESHRILKCLVVVDLKVVEFEPEFAGKMNFYLELLDEQVKQEDDNPTIGIILCPEKDDIEVEYALRTSSKPIGVAEYKLTHELPEQLKGKIPTAGEIKKLLTKYKR